MMVIDPINGKKADFRSKKTIVEVFKESSKNLKNNAFKNINDRLKNNNILENDKIKIVEKFLYEPDK